MLAREGGSCSSDDPDLDVGGCLAHQWGDDANDSYEIDLDLVVGGFARGSEEGVVVFASVGDDEFDESRFGSGHDHGDGDLVGVGPHVFSDDGDEALDLLTKTTGARAAVAHIKKIAELTSARV